MKIIMKYDQVTKKTIVRILRSNILLSDLKILHDSEKLKHLNTNRLKHNFIFDGDIAECEKYIIEVLKCQT